MDEYNYWPPGTGYTGYSGYYPPPYGGSPPWFNQASHTLKVTNAPANTAAPSEDNPGSEVESGTSSEDESDAQVSLGYCMKDLL